MYFVGPHPHREMPKFLSLADVVILNLEDTVHARAQVPGKVFEAMAMAKPIIGTQISDLPQILNNCGMILKENSPTAIAQALAVLMQDRNRGKQLGAVTRQKCIEYYSWNAMERILMTVLNKYKTEDDNK